MKNTVTLSQEEYDEFLSLYIKVLDWKAAGVMYQLSTAQQGTAERIAETTHIFMECESALFKAALSKPLRRRLLSSMGMEPADSDDAV